MKLGLKMVDVRILKIDSEMTTPHYAHEGDAAFDLRSAEEIIIPAKGRYTVKSGIKMAIPEGYFGLIKDRSGYAHKKGIPTMIQSTSDQDFMTIYHCECLTSDDKLVKGNRETTLKEQIRAFHEFFGI